MTRVSESITSFDDLPTVAFERILDNLNDQDIAPFHLVSKRIFQRTYEYIRHGREQSRKDREKDYRRFYPNDPPGVSPEVHASRRDYVRYHHVNLRPRFYQLIIYVGRVLPREGEILIDAYKDVLTYSFIRKLREQSPYIHFERLCFNFREVEKFYKGNVSYRMLFDEHKSPYYYSIAFRRSNWDIPSLARKKGNRIRKELATRPYSSQQSLKYHALSEADPTI